MADVRLLARGAPFADEFMVSADQSTITGNGTFTRPLVAVGGGGGESLVTNVKDFGAVGDGVTDDWAAITAAIASAGVTGKPLYFPAGRYRTSLFLYLSGFSGFRVIGDGATILYPSDDTSIQGADFPQTATLANPNTAARSGLLLSHCTQLAIQGTLTLEGGHAQEITTVNVGAAVYATHCVDLDLEYWPRYGAAPLQQEATSDSSGTGDSLSATGDVVTIVDASAPFVAGQGDLHSITLGGTTHPQNSGTFPILEFVSATTLRFQNPAGVAEVSAFAWSIDDGDRLTDLRVHAYGCRSPITPCPQSRITGEITQPTQGADLTGTGDSLSISGTTVTLRDAGLTSSLLSDYRGRYVRIAGATSPANNGWFQVLTATPATLFTPGTLTFTNAAGVSEAFPGTWWIMGGDVSGVGAGPGALSVAAGVVTLTASQPSFDDSMVGMVIRIADATSANNNGGFVIRSVPAPDQVTFGNPLGVSEAFSHGWAIDAYDAGHDLGLSYGSSHGAYLFAGRSDVQFYDMKVTGIREDAFKVSGSSRQIQDVSIRGCTIVECGAAVVMGADDSQVHANLAVTDCLIQDCGTGRPGWTEQIGVQVLGARGVLVGNNQFYYTRNAIAAVDGTGSVHGNFCISASRFRAGRSQPLEDLAVLGNKFHAVPGATSSVAIAQACIHVDSVGLRARYATAGTLTGPTANPVTGVVNTMTLTDPDAEFSQELVGCPIELVFCANVANNVTSTVTAVPSGTTLTLTNASGVAGAVGTYRIQGDTADVGDLGGECTIAGNQIHSVGQVGIDAQSCVSPQIIDNVVGGVEKIINASLSVGPYVDRNRRIGTRSISAGIQIDSGTSWPIVGSNPIVSSGNQLSFTAERGDVGIGVDTQTPIDYPLCGVRGRVQPTQAQSEVVMAYGSNLVDGDFFFINGGIKYTYKAVITAGHQFNTMAGLIALINADGLVAADYGATFTVPVTTGHIRIRRATPGTNDSALSVDTIHVLNPTALVAQRNATGGGEAFCESRGSGSAGPTPDKAVVWTPCATLAGGVVVYADNASAQTLLQANGWSVLKNTNNAGCCEVVTFGTSAGTEEFRWAIPT